MNSLWYKVLALKIRALRSAGIPIHEAYGEAAKYGILQLQDMKTVPEEIYAELIDICGYCGLRKEAFALLRRTPLPMPLCPILMSLRDQEERREAKPKDQRACVQGIE